jgi:hypothetical protein
MSHRAGVKFVIFITFVGIAYSIFNVVRAAFYLNTDEYGQPGIALFIIVLVGQILSFIFDVMFLHVAIPYINQRGRHNNDDRIALANSIWFLVARDILLHLSNGIGYLVLGLAIH